MTEAEREFHLKHFELVVDAVWKSQDITNRHLTFFFTTLVGAIGGLGFLAKTDRGLEWGNLIGLAALTIVLILMLGLFTLDVVVKRALATRGFLYIVEALRDQLGEPALTARVRKLVYRADDGPLANEGARRLIISTNAVLLSVLAWLGSMTAGWAAWIAVFLAVGAGGVLVVIQDRFTSRGGSSLPDRYVSSSA